MHGACLYTFITSILLFQTFVGLFIKRFLQEMMALLEINNYLFIYMQ